MRNESYIIVPNEVFFGDEDERLCVEELYMFCYLLLNKSFMTNQFLTNIKVLLGEFIFEKNPNRNKKRILTHLESLIEKGYFFVDDEEKILDENFIISFPKEQKKEKGFTKIPNLFLQKFSTTAIEFSLLVYVKMKEFKTNAISIPEFRTALLNNNRKSFSRNTIFKTLDELENRGILTITRNEKKKWMVNIDNQLMNIE